MTNLFIQTDEQRAGWPWSFQSIPKRHPARCRCGHGPPDGRKELHQPNASAWSPLSSPGPAARPNSRRCKQPPVHLPASMILTSTLRIQPQALGCEGYLEDGSLIVHLDTTRVKSPPMMEPCRLIGSGDGQTWLTVLGGAPAGVGVASSLRGAGSPLVITNQFRPHLICLQHAIVLSIKRWRAATLCPMPWRERACLAAAV